MSKWRLRKNCSILRVPLTHRKLVPLSSVRKKSQPTKAVEDREKRKKWIVVQKMSRTTSRAWERRLLPRFFVRLYRRVALRNGASKKESMTIYIYRQVALNELEGTEMSVQEPVLSRRSSFDIATRKGKKKTKADRCWTLLQGSTVSWYFSTLCGLSAPRRVCRNVIGEND